ncbi:MAG: sugar phosphate isomerase/epimerase [Cyclobacteriaceae bacterium]|jgi:sugar phosphate isomerase/epimerase
MPAFLSSCQGAATKEGQSEEATIPLFFSISLAQWSLHRSFFGDIRKLGWAEFGRLLKENPDALLSGELNPVDFPRIARADFGLSAIEYVNTFYFSKGEDTAFWNDMKSKCDGEGIASKLIMCDAEGNLGDTNTESRNTSVRNHYKWVDAANILGCHSIRVNAAGSGSADEVRDAAVDGLGQLTEYGAKNGINIIVENHGGYSSDGKWLADVISQVNSPYCGTLPDFGNFCLEKSGDDCLTSYDKYQGVSELLPFAKGVSAKTYDFDKRGNETTIDYVQMLKLVKASGFTGTIGIEYEGDRLNEKDGINATIALLKKAGAEV